MAFDRLIERIATLQNPTVAGLDPKLDYIPSYIKEEAFAKYGKNLEGAAAAILEFNKGLIDALCEIVPAVKPQCAYYEMYGWQGVKTLHDTIAYASEKGMFVITDGKRNDIGTTMEAYAAAHLGTVLVEDELCVPFGGDALTVNGYLVRTASSRSSPSARRRIRASLCWSRPQTPPLASCKIVFLDDQKTLYATMGALCEQWGEELPGKYGYSGVGAVVGATYPEQLRELRSALPHTFFLVPGYGAQGGGAKDVAPAFDANGRGAIVNASRSILCAWQKQHAPEHD